MKCAREYKRIAKRMAEAFELEEAWKVVEEIYGSKATKQLKEIAPADPLLLHDLMVISHLNDGRTRKEVQNLLDGYNEKDWEYDMSNFARTIKRAKEEYVKRFGL